MTSKNTNKLLEILKSTKSAETPSFSNIVIKNKKNEIIEMVDSHPISGKVISGKYSISATNKDVLAYITDSNQLNVVIGDKIHASAIVPKKFSEIKICRFDAIFVFLRNEEGVKVYKTGAKKKLEEFATIKYQLEDIIMVEGSNRFFCFINDQNNHNIYAFDAVGKKFENTLVSSFKCPYVANKKRLFVYDGKCYFLKDDKLYNITNKDDVIDGTAIYCFKNRQLVLKEKGNNIFVTLAGTGLTYFISKVENQQIMVHKDCLILYKNDDITFYRIDQNLQLEKIVLKIECCKTEDIYKSELLIQDDSILLYLFCKENQKENIKENTYENLIAKIQQIKNSPSKMHNMLAKETGETKEKPNTAIEEHKKDRYGDLEEKIEKLIIDVEEQRKQCEEENKAKFLQLLEVVNNHLNENLVKGIENAIKKEVKTGITQIKKSMNDSMNEMELKTKAIGKQINKVVEQNEQILQTQPTAHHLAAFREVLTNEILPIVENCFEEIKLQMLAERDHKCKNNLVDSKEATVTIKDEIAKFLENGFANEAAIFALDSEDSDLLQYFFENLSTANIEKLNPQLQFSLIQKGYSHLSKNVEMESTIKCLCNLIMHLDINEVNENNIMELLGIFDELTKVEWSEQTHLNLIIKMQRRHAMKRMNKKQ